jgi:hypothetical protein
MTLPNPDQVKDYPTAHESLCDWLWEHPEGGDFSMSLNGQTEPIIGKLSKDLKKAGWHAECVKSKLTTAIRISPSG